MPSRRRERQGAGAPPYLPDDPRRFLRDLPGSGRAFTAYERLRCGRAEKIVARGARTSNSKAAGPVGRAPRDLILPMILKRVAHGGSLTWMHDHHIDRDEKVAP